MSKITNSVALVTGSNRGIGKAFVEGLLKAGAKKVYAASRDLSKLSDLLPAWGDRVQAIELDVTDYSAIEKLAGELSDVNLLINNAGVAAFQGLIAAESLEAARFEMETNYFGTLALVRAFAPVLKSNGGGGIINISSVAGGLVCFPVLGSYSASKAAVHTLSQGIRAELAAQNTYVAAVYPGPVDTDMAENFPMDKTAPSQVVQNIFDSIDEGIFEIYPDPASVEMNKVFRADPAALEKEAGSMLP
jgi:NAD(P)-dependent dehydrogenase (short-subunit alcohol dehydrogenase family)